VDGLTALLDPLALSGLVINLLIGALLSSGVAWYYARFGEAFANRVKLAKLLPILCLTTLLVISVVKASLALSLGLVGALSIVRFRTAIKEPEELLYLFIAIAIGIGLGADQRLATVVAIGFLLVFLISTRLFSLRSHQNNLYLNIRVPEREDANMLESVSDILGKHAERVDVRRLDRQDHTLQITFLLDCKDPQKLARLMDDLKANLPDSSFSFVDQGDMPR
jgi:uncharacterized membrane protein YhiD involved in acid resistance